MSAEEQAALSLKVEQQKDKWDEQAWLVTKEKNIADTSKFGKEVARCWDEASFSTKFAQFHPGWQKVLLSFARKVNKIKIEENV